MSRHVSVWRRPVTGGHPRCGEETRCWPVSHVMNSCPVPDVPGILARTVARARDWLSCAPSVRDHARRGVVCGGSRWCVWGRRSSSSSHSRHESSSHKSSNRDSRRISTQSIPKGRAISPSRIIAPQPERPHQTRQVINTQYDKATLEALTSRFSRQTISPGVSESDSDSYIDSDDESDVPSLTSRSTNSSSPSSVSSGSSCCTCERYGITRSGDRVKLDCGGARCGYSDDSSDCSSEDELVYEEKTTRRQGVLIRS